MPTQNSRCESCKTFMYCNEHKSDEDDITLKICTILIFINLISVYYSLCLLSTIGLQKRLK